MVFGVLKSTFLSRNKLMDAKSHRKIFMNLIFFFIFSIILIGIRWRDDQALSLTFDIFPFV